jgi:hypothetical protein
MQAVIRAILLDPEARRGDDSQAPVWPMYLPVSSHLREPVFVVASILRGLGAQVNDTNNLTAQAANLGQTLFLPPTVFNYFAPGYQIPPELTAGTVLLGPEFQLDSPSNAVARFNMVNSMIYGNLGTGAVIDFTPFSNFANNPQKLVDAVGQAFMYGQMPPTVQTALLGAVNAIPGTSAAVNKARAQAAIYLAVSSSYYNVEH